MHQEMQWKNVKTATEGDAMENLENVLAVPGNAMENLKNVLGAP